MSGALPEIPRAANATVTMSMDTHNITKIMNKYKNKKPDRDGPLQMTKGQHWGNGGDSLSMTLDTMVNMKGNLART